MILDYVSFYFFFRFLISFRWGIIVFEKGFFVRSEVQLISRHAPADVMLHLVDMGNDMSGVGSGVSIVEKLRKVRQYQDEYFKSDQFKELTEQKKVEAKNRKQDGGKRTQAGDEHHQMQVRVFRIWGWGGEGTRFQNDSKTIPKRCQHDPETTPNQFQNDSKTIPQRSHYPKTIPKRFQHDPNTSQNDTKTTPTQFQNDSKTNPKRFQNDPNTINFQFSIFNFQFSIFNFQFSICNFQFSIFNYESLLLSCCNQFVSICCCRCSNLSIYFQWFILQTDLSSKRSRVAR